MHQPTHDVAKLMLAVPLCIARTCHVTLVPIRSIVALVSCCSWFFLLFLHALYRYDFYQVLRELELHGGRYGLQALADAAFSEADAAGRGIVNFGQVLVWYSSYLAASSRHQPLSQSSSSSSSSDLLGTNSYAAVL